MDEMLGRRGQKLEELFFHEKNKALIEQHQRLEQLRHTRKALEEVSGIQNHQLLDKLMELDVSPAILASLAVVPLVEVAWADGTIHENERKAILSAATANGIGNISVDYELLETWMEKRPPKKLLKAWTHFIAGLCETMSETERNALKSELLSHAQAVAESAGGFLGLTSKISAQEQAVLDEMAAAFS